MAFSLCSCPARWESLRQREDRAQDHSGAHCQPDRLVHGVQRVWRRHQSHKCVILWVQSGSTVLSRPLRFPLFFLEPNSIIRLRGCFPTLFTNFCLHDLSITNPVTFSGLHVWGKAPHEGFPFNMLMKAHIFCILCMYISCIQTVPRVQCYLNKHVSMTEKDGTNRWGWFAYTGGCLPSDDPTCSCHHITVRVQLTHTLSTLFTLSSESLRPLPLPHSCVFETAFHLSSPPCSVCVCVGMLDL